MLRFALSGFKLDPFRERERKWKWERKIRVKDTERKKERKKEKENDCGQRSRVAGERHLTKLTWSKDIVTNEA